MGGEGLKHREDREGREGGVFNLDKQHWNAQTLQL